MARKLMLILMGLSFASPMVLTGCNTIGGAGTDVKAAGQKLSDEAREHKSY